MMQLFLLWSLLAVVTVCASQKDENAKLLDSNFEEYNPETKKYEYSFETSNGITKQETGVVHSDDKEDGDLEVEGSYSFEGTDGFVYTVTYTAGKNGFKPIIMRASIVAVPKISSFGYTSKNRISGSVLASLAGG